MDHHVRTIGRIDGNVVGGEFARSHPELGAPDIRQRLPRRRPPLPCDRLGQQTAGKLGRLRPVAHERLADLDRRIDQRDADKDGREAAGKPTQPVRFGGRPEPHQGGKRRKTPKRKAPHGDRLPAEHKGHGGRHQEWTQRDRSDVAPRKTAGIDRLYWRCAGVERMARKRDRWKRGEQLARGPDQRKRQILVPMRRRDRARVDVAERQKAAVHEPPQIWRHDDEKRTAMR